MIDFLRGIRELNRVSNYTFHDRDSVCSSILYAARFRFVDRMSKMVIQKETIYEDFPSGESVV